MNSRGYKMMFYKIDYSIYQNRPKGVTPEEHLEYIQSYKKGKTTYWVNSEKDLRNVLSERYGYLSNADSVIQEIMTNETTSFYYAPGLLASNQDYEFFYIRNNNF